MNVLPVRIVMKYTCVYCIDQTLHLTMLALEGTVRQEMGITPGNIGQSKDITNLRVHECV